MDSAKVCLLLVLLVGICAGQQDPFPFHCAVTGCEGGGTCDDATGICTCTDPTTEGGYWCEIDLTLTCTDAAKTCDTGLGETCGVVKTTLEEKCICSEGYTTQFSAGKMECTVLRFEAFCPGDTVEGSLYTYLGADFTGLVYQVPDSADLTQKCVVPSTLDADGRMTFVQKIDGTVTYPDCTDKGIAFPDQTTADTRSLFVYIQYIPNVDATFNKIFEFRCTIRDDGSFVSEVFNIGYNDVTSALVSGRIYLNGGGVEITGFLNFKGIPVKEGDILNVGDEMEVAVYKTIADSTYTIWNLDTMTTASTEAADAESIVLIENGCATKAGKILIKSIENINETLHQITGTKSSAVKALFKGHKFDSTTQLWVILKYKLCLKPETCVTGCPDDNKYQATVEDQTAKRRKRAVFDGADGAKVPMNFTLNIYDSTGAGKNSWTGGENTDISSCVQSIVFIVPLILLVVLVVVAMAIAVYFFTKLNRQRNKSDAMDNMAYKS